jgi:hypothetical protein
VTNHLWRPDPDEPRLYEWWQPLHRFAARARADDLVWDVHPEHFEFVGRVLRSPRPTVHLYVHHETAGTLALADDGSPFRVTRAGAYLPSDDLSVACWKAGLPYVQMRQRRPDLDEVDRPYLDALACDEPDEGWESTAPRVGDRNRPRRPALRLV